MPAMWRASRARNATKPTATAHFRHALEVAEEQVEEIQEIRVGDVMQYLFEAEVYATRDEAEEMRAARIGVVARRFYEELPAALAGAASTRSDCRPANAPASDGNEQFTELSFPASAAISGTREGNPGGEIGIRCRSSVPFPRA